MVCYIYCIQYTLVGLNMNKSTLLIAGVVTGLGVVLGYNFLGDDVEPVENQQSIKAERAQIKTQPVSSSSEIESVSIANDNKHDKNTAVVKENTVVRRAPPPPISATLSREVAHSSPHAHGHEVGSDDGQQRNAPPPPTGANQ